MFSIKTPKGLRQIGPGQPAFIVAEMSANHQQDFKEAVKIVEAVAKTGADAVKLQTYTADTITLNSNKKWFRVGGKENPKSWQDKTFYQLYEKAYMPWEWHKPLQKIAYKHGIVLFSSPFDDTAVDFLEELYVPCYKIASYEATDIPLLKKVAKTGKPIIMSIGFATLDEIKYSVNVLRENGVSDLALLQCTTSYSATGNSEYTNLQTMLDLQKRFNVVIGFSDNMGGIEIPVQAMDMGGSILEKHFVVKHNAKAFDDRFSLDFKEFKKMVDTIRSHEKVKGKVVYGPQTPAEKYNRRFRRSLFVAEDIKKGEKFTTKNVRDVRPAFGLETRYFSEVIGKIAAKNISRGTPLKWNLINDNK